MQLCSSLSILWHCLSFGLEWKLTFSSPVVAAEFSKFADIMSASLSQHHKGQLLLLMQYRLKIITYTCFGYLIWVNNLKTFSRLKQHIFITTVMRVFSFSWSCLGVGWNCSPEAWRKWKVHLHDDSLTYLSASDLWSLWNVFRRTPGPFLRLVLVSKWCCSIFPLSKCCKREEQ